MDTLVNGERFRILTLVDDFTRDCLGLAVDTSLTALRVVRDPLSVFRRGALKRFLADGRIEIDSNTVERAIRPQTVTRKNSLFAGSNGGGRKWATIATPLATARTNQVGPLAWLTHTLERLANRWPNSRIDELMPWNYQS